MAKLQDIMDRRSKMEDNGGEEIIIKKKDPVKESLSKELIGDKEKVNIDSAVKKATEIAGKVIEKGTETLVKKVDEAKKIQSYDTNETPHVEMKIDNGKVIVDGLEEDNELENSDSDNDSVKITNRRSKLQKKFSKLEKLRSIKKRGNSAKLPLINSGFMITIYESNSILDKTEMLNRMDYPDEVRFHSLSNLKTFFESLEFNFVDGDKITFDNFLSILDPRDIPLLHIYWSFINSRGKDMEGMSECENCGHFQKFDNVSMNKVMVNLRKDYGIETESGEKILPRFKEDVTIDILQENLLMGKTGEMNFEVDGVKFELIVEAPSTKRVHKIENAIKVYIVNKFQDMIPSGLKNKHIKKQINYLLTEYETDVTLELSLISNYITNVKSVTISYPEVASKEVFSIEDDGVEAMVETLRTIDCVYDISKIGKFITEEFNSGKDFIFKDSPFICEKCEEVSSRTVEGIDAILFTIQESLKR